MHMSILEVALTMASGRLAGGHLWKVWLPALVVCLGVKKRVSNDFLCQDYTSPVLLRFGSFRSSSTSGSSLVSLSPLL